MKSHALVIDDDDNSLQVLGSLLQNQGLTHTTVNDPSEALQTMAELEHISVIFCDLEMPHLTGYDLFPMLREAVGTKTPIIVSSVHLSEINHVRELGFNGFLGKPLDPDRFPAYLARILDGKSVWILP